MTRDPVCGTWVDETQTPFTDFEGEEYHFCSQDCKLEFDDDPDRYVGWGGTARFGSA